MLRPCSSGMSHSSYCGAVAEEPTVDLAGAPPGSWAIDLVRDDTVPSCSLVWVIDLLQVPPPSLAWALECALVAFGFTCDCEEALPPAALPPTPIEDEVPSGPVEVPAVPSVDADVPPAAPLPALPTVAEEPDGDEEAPPVAAPLALCPIA